MINAYGLILLNALGILMLLCFKMPLIYLNLLLIAFYIFLPYTFALYVAMTANACTDSSQCSRLINITMF